MGKRAPSEDGKLDNPVVDGQADQNDESSCWDDRGVHESKPDNFDGLGEMFAQGCRLVHHEMISLSLGEFFPTVVDAPLDNPKDLQRVDQPQKRNEKTIDHKHNGFLFHYAELILEYVVESDPLDQQGHDSCRQEKSNCVLDREVVFLLGMG